MGEFKIEISAVGGHGCDRNAKPGQQLYGCNKLFCPDCQAREFVRLLQRIGQGTNIKATLTHWPGTPAEVIDDLVATKRASGQFTP